MGWRTRGVRSVLGAWCVVLVGSAGCDAQATAPDSPEDSLLASGDHEVQLEHDGRTRRYFVHIPSGAGADAAVVVALHGGGGTGSGMQQDYDLDAVADREGFIVVYPDGTGPISNRLLTWNAGPHCCGYARDRDVDDVGFLITVLDDLERRADMDSRRVYLTGHSNGAMMAYRLAVEAPSRVAAVVGVAGAMGPDLPDGGGLSVPALHIHSVDDPRALYHGGEGPPFPGTNSRVQHVPVDSTLAFWVARNGCESTPSQVGSGIGQGRDPGQSWVKLRWSCDGAPLEHLRLEGVGHGWPGVRVGLVVQGILGRATTMVYASEEVWEFASRFSR